MSEQKEAMPCPIDERLYAAELQNLRALLDVVIQEGVPTFRHEWARTANNLTVVARTADTLADIIVNGARG